MRNALRILLTLTLCGIAPVASAQNSLDGHTPKALEPGAPAGSYSLKDFERINLYNGHLNLSFPLYRVSGRGEVGYTIRLTVESKWTVRTVTSHEIDLARYNWSPWAEIHPGYSPGVLLGRQFSKNLAPANPCGHKSITRLTFIASDGTELELRDTEYQGEPVCTTGSYPNRKTIWESPDGSATTFVSATEISDVPVTNVSGSQPKVIRPSGELLMADGMRYRIENGLVTSMRDRNGNLLTLTYEDDADGKPRVKTVRDSRRREVTFVYDNWWDQIWFKGYEGGERAIEIRRAPMSQVLGPFETIRTTSQLFPDLHGQSQVPFDPQVTSEVFLPNNRSFQFQYNSYGEVTAVFLATGGRINYWYDKGLRDGFSGGLVAGPPEGGWAVYRRLVARAVYAGGLDNVKFFSRPETRTSNDGSVEVEEQDRDGVPLRITEHRFGGDGASKSFQLDAFAYAPWRNGLEDWTTTMEGDRTVRRRVVTEWEQGGQVPWWTGSPDAAPSLRTRVRQRFVQMDAVTSKEVYEYDEYNNRTQVDEHDFGAYPNVGPLLRRTVTDFVTLLGGVRYDKNLDIHLRRLPARTRVFDGGGVLRADTSFEYDDYSGAAYHAPLVERPNISEHEGAYDASWTRRGNVTAVARWLDDPPGDVRTYSQYDVAGNVVKSVDGRGHATAFSFGDNWGGASGSVEDGVTPAELVKPGGGAYVTYATVTRVTNALGHTTRAKYDYHLGAAVDDEDANGVVSSTRFYDMLDRPTRRVLATNHPSARTDTIHVYNDGLRTVTTLRDQRLYLDHWRKSVVSFDSMGRPYEADTWEDETTYTWIQRFVDPLGRIGWVSNPQRVDTGTPDPPNGPPQWTRKFYDVLDRPTRLETPDTAATVTTYEGDTILVVDAAGKKRKSVLDGLGRTVKVVEDPGGQGHVTTYEYDVFDNVTKVSQGIQTRTFRYDSLGRLRSVTNPESGTEVSTYDANGNLLTRTDARGVVTTNTYDALDRVRTRSYSGGGPDVVPTPTVTFAYDSPGEPGSFSVGRLTSVSSSVSTTTYALYDALGRVVKSVQRTAGRDFPFSYAYNRASELVSVTYPSGRRFLTDFDPAGRVEMVAEPGYVYAGQISYHPHGVAKEMRLGSGLWESTGFTKRLQPSFIGLGTLPTHPKTWLLSFRYGNLDSTGPTPENNGNIAWQILQVWGVEPTWHYFTYDALNRLETATEIYGWDERTAWKQTYGYDRFGNRAVLDGSYRPSPQTPQGVGAYNVAKNQLWTAQYDAAGNQTADPAGRTYQYDAEDRQRRFQSASGVTQYFYDGGGRRVVATTQSKSTIYVYDAFGKLAAEYGSVGGAASTGITYLTLDHLGTPRVATDAEGHVVARHDYLPFGEEIPHTFGFRPAIPGFGVDDGVTQKFSGKERDAESGNDFFGARYFSSATGRFLVADPQNAGANLKNPQSWNGYAYSLNNPGNLVDRGGLYPTIPRLAYHQRAIENALSHAVSASDQAILKAGVRWADSWQFQSEKLAFRHAMRAPNQSKDEARTLANNFVKEQIAIARKFESASRRLSGEVKADYHATALTHLALAMHTLQDATSPAHKDWQVWSDHMKTCPEDFIAHTLRESRYPTDGEIERATLQAWAYFLGEPIPEDVFDPRDGKKKEKDKNTGKPPPSEDEPTEDPFFCTAEFGSCGQFGGGHERAWPR